MPVPHTIRRYRDTFIQAFLDSHSRDLIPASKVDH
jgi:hypothetical protein